MAHPAGSCNRRLHIWGGDKAGEMAQPRRGPHNNRHFRCIETSAAITTWRPGIFFVAGGLNHVTVWRVAALTSIYKGYHDFFVH